MVGLASMRSGNTKKKELGALKAGKIISILFADRTFTHMAHLKTSSYAQHKALNCFYDDVVGLVDELAEVAQGKFGKIDIPVSQVSTEMAMPADALEKSLESILAEAEGCGNGAMKNIVDEIEALYLKTIYLIRELH